MSCFKKGFRSFNTENLGSVGQRASKLPAVKVGGYKKKSAPLEPVGPDSRSPRVKSFSKFDGWLVSGQFGIQFLY